MSTCTLRRCQGKRGCVCPKGVAPIGSFGCRKDVVVPVPDVTDNTVESAVPKASLSSMQLRKSSPSRMHPSPPKNVRAKKPLSVKVCNDPSTNSDVDGNSAMSIVEPLILPKNCFESPSAETSHGDIVVRYNHYKKSFKIENNSTTAAVIDAEYVLSFAYPNCKIHLSLYGPSDFSFEEQGFSTRPCIKEKPEGHFQGLEDKCEYWVVVEEDESEKKAYEARQELKIAENAERRAAKEAREADGLSEIVVSKSESCSCIEGNPCLDKYCCKDWNNRFEVAKQYGWKGFS